MSGWHQWLHETTPAPAEQDAARPVGATVFAYQVTDPVTVTIRSSRGGIATAATTPFRPEN